jgi:hypothetical protein
MAAAPPLAPPAAGVPAGAGGGSGSGVGAERLGPASARHAAGKVGGPALGSIDEASVLDAVEAEVVSR